MSDTETMEALVATITLLDDRLSAIEAAGSRPPRSGSGGSSSAPVDQEAVDRRFEWWLEWLNRAYSLDLATRGWDQLDGVRYELEALHRWYEAAIAPDARAGELSAWHDALARALPRISNTKPNHRDRADKVTSASAAPEHMRWGDWLAKRESEYTATDERVERVDLATGEVQPA